MNGLSKYYIKKLITCFADEMTATETARKLKVNRNTVNKYFRIIREAIADYQQLQVSMQLHSSNKQIVPFYWHKSTGISMLNDSESAIFYIVTINKNAYVEQEQDAHKSDSLLGISPQIAPKYGDLAQSFFIYTKDKLTKFYGVKEEYTYLYLKELEFRFNNREKEIAKLIWRILPHHSAEWVKTTRFRK